MPDPSDLGCAIRPDNSLKDASEIEWSYDKDNDSPMAPVSSTSESSTTVHPFFTRCPPAKVVAGSRRSARALRPSARIRDPDNVMNNSASSSSAPNPSAANGKRKAPPSLPSRRIARKVDIDLGDECDAEYSFTAAASQPRSENSDTEPETESGTNKYEALQSMADADHQVCHATVHH